MAFLCKTQLKPTDRRKREIVTTANSSSLPIPSSEAVKGLTTQLFWSHCYFSLNRAEGQYFQDVKSKPPSMSDGVVV